MNYGYVRVSTREQNIDRQLRALLDIGIDKNNIFIDKASGKNFNRKNFLKLLKLLKKNDVLFLKSLDRLGRNYEEIISVWNLLTKEIEIDIVIMDFPLLDTRNKIDNLTGKFIADIVLQVLSYVAQIERENTLQRQKEGIIEAKKKGIVFGRPELMKPKNFKKVCCLCINNHLSFREAAKQLDIPLSTFYRWYKQFCIHLKK